MSSVLKSLSRLLSSIDFKDKWVRIIIALIACVILFVIFLTPRNDISKVNSVSKPVAPTEVATVVEVIYSDSARVKAKLNTPKMIRYLSADATMEMPKGLQIYFYDKNLNVNSKLKSNYGIRYTTKNLTVMRGHVVVVNVKGDTLKTEELLWHEDTNKVTSGRLTTVKTKDETIIAKGFESDINFTHYTFFHTIGTVRVKDKI